MINNKKILGLIPARGNSKGLPNKNIKLFHGNPLICKTINEAKKSKIIDKLILSSEDDKIISIAKENGCEVPFKRPKNLSRDDTKISDVFLHAVKNYPGYDILVVLQPTTPLRTSQDIDNTILKLINSNSKSCVSVSDSESNPYWMYTMNENSKLFSLFPEKKLAANRQELPKTYSLNGAVYAAFIDFFIENKSFFYSNTIGYVMPRLRSIDIDDEVDFFVAEVIYKNLND